MQDPKKYYLDQAQNVNFILRVFYAICAALAVIDVVYHRHAVHAWEKLLGFYPLYGFVACVALVLIATQMRRVLMRGEDYYDDDDDGDDDGDD